MQIYMNSNINKYILARKGIHLGAALIPLSYYIFSRQQFIIFVSSLALTAIIIEVARFKNPKFKNLFYRIFGKLLWNNESKSLTSATIFILSSFICGIFFQKQVVITALLFLTFGDTISYSVGNTIGKIKIFGKKTLEGGIAFFLVSVIIAWLVQDMIFWVGLIGAVVACIVELLPWRVDDNLSIPIISGVIMELILRVI
ncbi:hypothetical protein KAW65_04235 [candidate division WOR-3 bacterium]|nr:hypothetical protein [candidate division WOR-3 bacterium]